MKLELKHLAPYLPYELKIEAPNPKRVIHTLIGLDLKDALIRVDKILENDLEHFGNVQLDFETIKPILRPLSDLAEYKKKTGLKLSHNSGVFIGCALRSWGASDVIEGIPYYDIVKLFENHFDVFGLIEQGLAIDINQLD